MYCENVFCIYQSKGTCILKDINIDNSGMCDSCIYIDLNSDKLEKYKQKLLNDFK